MKKIILVTDVRFWQASKGSENRILRLIKYFILKDLNIVLFFADSLTEDEHRNIKDISANIKVINKNITINKILLCLKRSAIFKKAKRALSRDNYIGNLYINWKIKRESRLDNFYSEDYLFLFQNLVKIERPDIIFVEYIKFHFLIKNSEYLIPDKCITVIDTHDVMHERCARFHEKDVPHWINISKEEERNALGTFDVIVGIQSSDSNKLKSLLPKKEIITIGYHDKIREPRFNEAKEVKLIYIGCASPANRRAIIYFNDYIYPILYKRFKGKIKLNVYGDVCNILHKKRINKEISLNGFVTDIDLIYRDTDIVINPIEIGGGLKIKNVEALCYSKPLVTTSVGAEGMEDGINNAFMVCDDKDSMINVLSELISSFELREQLSFKAHSFAKERFSEKYIYKDLDLVLKI